jgi:hypothetical protein
MNILLRMTTVKAVKINIVLYLPYHIVIANFEFLVFMWEEEKS